MSIRKTYPMRAYKIMHGFWGMGQAMFIKHLVVAVADLNSQPSTMNHKQTPGRKLGIDATKKIPGGGFKRPWPPLIKMDAAMKAKVEKLFKP